MTWVFLSTHAASRAVCDLAFPTGQDSATFRDKGTEVPSLSRDKGTTGQAQNLAMGRDGPGQPVNMRDGTWDGKITIFLSRFGMRRRMGQVNTIFFYGFLF